MNDGLPLMSNLKEVVSSRSINNGIFGQGLILFPFDIGPQERGMLNQSYLRGISASFPSAGTAGGYTTWAWSAPVKSFSNVASFTHAAGTPIVAWHNYEGHDFGLAENCMANMVV